MSTAWIKKKKFFEFSRKLVKYICFTVSILVIGIFLFITSVKTLEVIRVNAENTTRQTAETLVHEYALVFQYLFEGATAELKQFTNSPVFVKEKKRILTRFINGSKKPNTENLNIFIICFFLI